MPNTSLVTKFCDLQVFPLAFPDTLRANVKYTLYFCKFANFKIMFAAKLLHCKFFSQKAVTAWNFIIGGTMKSYGLLYVEFITLFQCTPTKAGLIGLVFGIVAMLICK